MREIQSSSQLTLRRLRLADAPEVQRQVSRPEVVRWTTRIPHPYPEGGAARFIRSSWFQWRAGRACVFGIQPSGAAAVCGVISLSGISQRHGCAELGLWVGREHWGRGIGTRAVAMMLEFGFLDLQLYRIYASAFAANAASRRVLEKCGFRLEGVLREAVVREGARQDYLNFGLLRPEWPGLEPGS